MQRSYLPLNYWLEYLDLVFFFKCKLGEVAINIDQYVNYTCGRSRRAQSGLYLNILNLPKQTFFATFFFVRMYGHSVLEVI